MLRGGVAGRASDGTGMGYGAPMYNAVVTGAASGIGLSLVQTLLRGGHRVVAVDLDASRLAAALPGQDRLTTEVVDVRDAAAVRALAARTPDVNLLVNNAGVGAWGSQEEADPGAVRVMFDVNVFGVMHLTQAFLPAIRAARGVIVQVSSISGHIVFPESGFYAASKHAVEAMTEALFQEVGRDGVRVRMVQPGSCETGFQAAASRLTVPPPAGSPYDDRRPTWNARRDALLAAPAVPQVVVDALMASLAQPNGFLRVPVGDDAVALLALRHELTDDEWVRLMAERNGVPADADSPLCDPSDPQRITDARRLANTYNAWRYGHLDHWSPEAVESWRRAWRHRFAGL